MNIIIESVNSFLHLYIAYLFFCTFWNCRTRNIVTASVFIVPGIVFAFTMINLKGNPILYLIMFAVTMTISLLFDGKLRFKVIYSVLFLTIGAFIEMATAISINTAFGVDFVEGKQGSLYVSGMLLSKFVLVIVIMILRFRKHATLVTQFRKRFFSIYLFPVATFLIGGAQHSIFVNNPNQSPSTLIFVLVCYTLLIIANMIVFDFIDSLYTNTVNEGKIITANDIINSQTEQYNALIDHNSQLAKIQHDNKHLFLGLISEMKRGNYDAVMNGLSEACEICEKDIVTDNSIMESIVNIKSREARKKGISIDYENRNLREITISPVDIAIVLGNALDNAVEACEKIATEEELTIYLYIALKGDALVISIKNPVRENVDVNNLISKKENTSLHGFGVISMKQIAKKYDGEVIFNCENNLFNTTIFMINR